MRSPYDTGRLANVSDNDLAHVSSYTDVARIVEQMRADLLTHPDEWENPTLERFLESLAAVLDAIPHGCANRGEPAPTEPTWKLLADVLVAASGYE